MPARAREQGQWKPPAAGPARRTLPEAVAEHGFDHPRAVAPRARQRAQESAAVQERARRGDQRGAAAAGERLDQDPAGDFELPSGAVERVAAERALDLLAPLQILLHVLVDLAADQRDLAAEGLAQPEIASDADDPADADPARQAQPRRRLAAFSPPARTA